VVVSLFPVAFAHLWFGELCPAEIGRITIDGKQCLPWPVCSWARLLELKKVDEAGTFTLTEPVASIPMERSFLPQDRWGAQMEMGDGEPQLFSPSASPAFLLGRLLALDRLGVVLGTGRCTGGRSPAYELGEECRSSSVYRSDTCLGAVFLSLGFDSRTCLSFSSTKLSACLLLQVQNCPTALIARSEDLT